MEKLSKAVFPVAGMGTRFLPATKANPKEMLPIVDKPLIQYAVEEAISAGFTELIFVTSSSKRSIEDHFDINFELEARLEAAGKEELLEIIHNILPRHVTCTYTRQAEPKGLGDAVLKAKNLVGDAPFAVLLADDLILSSPQSCLLQMANEFRKTHSSIIAVEKIAREDSKKYGVVDVKGASEQTLQLNAIVEKPEPEEAPSNLGVTGRYILTPAIFSHLEKTQQGSGNEVQLTDAISALLQEEPVYAYKFNGRRYDCGSKLGYLKATMACALEHEDLKDSFKAYLKHLTENAICE